MKIPASLLLFLSVQPAWAGGGAASSDSDLFWILALLILIICLPLLIPFIKKKFKKPIELEEE